MQELMLDDAILTWVVLPMVVIMMSTGLLRHRLQGLLKSPKTLVEKEVKHKGVVNCAKQLRMAGGFIGNKAWQVRRCIRLIDCSSCCCLPLVMFDWLIHAIVFLW
jgi:hypothetical protein